MPFTLYQIFRTPTQVKIIEELLKRPDEYFTLSRMSKIVQASPSAVSTKLMELKKLNIIHFMKSSEKAKIFRLNKENRVVRLLLEFYKELNKINS
ncbi:MAG: hypothetical protein ACP6IQ_00045 [Candidatus Njordarchaeia archaeon]|nr:hypothetical protein [Candidatus Korarchaeota archaeon]